MKAIIQRIRTAAMFAVLFAIGLASTAWAATSKANPVTGENQSYTYNYIGSGTWTASDWSPTPSKVPQASGSAVWDSLLIDGNLAVTAPSHVEGWSFRIGLFGGATLTVPYIRYWNGTASYAVVDTGSKLTIQSINTSDNWNATVNYYVAAAGGITYTCAFNPTVTANAIYNYNLKGAGSVVYERAVSSGSHVIKQADVTLSGNATPSVESKPLVSFGSGTTKAFTADAAIKVYGTDGITLVETVNLAEMKAAHTLTTSNPVGSVELVQTSTGIVLYYVDGDPSAVVAKTYTPSININFCFGNAPLTTAADVGYSDYAVPGTSWNNMTSTSPSSGNGTFTTPLSNVYAVKTDGTKSLVSGASVALSGTPGSYKCNSLAAATDLRHGYIDENANNTAPTVTVSGIPYDKYKVVVYTSTDTANSAFGYVSVNGTDYTYDNNELAEGTAAWGASGAKDTAKALAEGDNVLVTPVLRGSSTATISGHKGSSARGCIAAVQIVEYTPEIGENDLVIELDGDKTHTFEEAKTYDTVYVTGSGTLTFAGTASTATTLDISGSAAVNMNGSSLTPTAVTGTGTAIYTGVLPPTDKGWTDSANWTGTVWIKDFGSLSGGRASESLTADMPNWGNSKSKVKFTNVKAYAHNANLTCAYTLVLEDGAGSNEYAWRCDNGYQNNTLTVARLSGSGTFYDHSGPAATFTFNSFDGFTGKFDITSSGHQIKVPAGATLTVAQNSSIKFTSQGMLGTLNIPANVTLTSTGGDAVSHNNTGSSTVNVYGTLDFGTSRWTLGPNTTINLYQDAIVCGTGDGNAAMDFNVADGSTIHALGNATISCKIRNVYANGTAKINVDAGKTLTFSGNLVGSYGLKKQGGGILKLTGSIAKLPTIDAGTVLLGGNKEWNLGTLRDLSGYTLEAGSSIVITQTMAEYGSGVTTVTGVDSSITSITVNKKDGTTATLTRTDSTSTLVESVVVSGAACWYDFTFTNTITTASGSSAGAVTLGKDAGPAYGTLTDAANNTYSGLYAYCRPYKDINLGSTTQFTVALYGTMPNADNTILLDCGGCGSAGALLLASGSSANEAKLYYYNSSGLTPLTTMAATSCRTTPHLYVFEKISDHQVNIYLDGKLALAYVNNDITFTLTAGFQVASGYASVPSGLNAIAKTATTDTTIIAMTRIYDRIISDAEMAVLKTEWPYFSPNGDSARTLASGETAADWTETGKWTVNNASADTPLANSVVTLTNSAEADVAVAVNLDGNTEYESVTFAGDAAISVALKSGYTGKIVPAAASIETDTTLAVNAVDLAQGPVEVADGKTLTFDVTSLINDTANSLAPVQLSGVATLGAGAAIAVTPTTSTLWNITATPDDGGNYWVNFNPKRANTSIYWKSTNSGDWTGVNDANHIFTTEAGGETTTPFYFGDTVVIRDDVQLCLKDSAAGISFSIENNATVKFSRSDDGATYAMKGQTVAIAAGATAQPERYANNGWDAGNPTIYGVTFTGYGNVKVVNGETLTLSGGSVISAPLTGSGTVNLESTSSMTVAPGASWTGTVVLPAITSNVNLTLYGNSDSTIGITSLNTYLTSPYTEIDSTLRLDGAMTISAFSDRDYSFTKITGNGNLTFPNSNSPTSIAITELANYTGTLINNHESVGVAVTRVTKSVDVDGGALLLATNGVGEVSVSSFEVAGVAVSHYAAAGGFYRGAARYDGTVYKTFAEAIAAADLAGETYADVTILDESAECPAGYYLSGTAGSKTLTRCAARSGEEGSYVYYNDVVAIYNALSAQKDLVLTVLDGNGAGHESNLKTIFPTLTYNSTDQILYIVVAKIGETGYRSFAAAIDAASSGQTIQLISSSKETITLDKTIILSGASYFSGTFTGTGKVTLDALMLRTIVAAGWSGTVVLPAVTDALNLAYYGVSGSTVELTSMSGYFQHTGSTYNFNIAPNIKISGSCTVLTEATSGLYYSFQTISGTGTLTLNNNANSISVAKVSDFSGSIVNNSAAALTIARLELSAAPTAGQCVLTTGGTGTVNVSSVYVGETQQSVTLAKGSDGIYAALVSVTKGGNPTTYYATVSDAMTAAGSDAATITLLGNTDSNVSLAVGQSLVTGGFSVGTVSTSAENYHVVNNAGVYTVVLDTYTITIPSVANTTVSVDYVKDGAAANATTAGNITVDAGTSLTATWTAASGYRITAGASQTINPVAAAQTLAEPTVVANAVTFTGYTVEYTADYSKAATISATVSGEGAEGATYTLTAGGNNYNGTYNAGTVTFSNITAPSLGSELSYTISASGAASGTSGAQTETVGNVTSGWVQEDATHNESTGTWETDIAYSDGVATITDNTYTPTKPGNGIVTLETVVKFGNEADPKVAVGDGAQAAFRVSGGKFEVYGKETSNGEAGWQTTEVVADVNATYTVKLVINYNTGTFTASVKKESEQDATPLGDTWYLATAATKVSSIAYKGTGAFTSLNGSFISGDVDVTVDETGVAVSSDFIGRYLGTKTVSEATELLAPNSAATCSNGYNYFTNYALGLDPTKEEDKPIVDVTVVDGNYVFKVKHPVYNEQGAIAGYEEIDAADNVSTTVTLKYGTDAQSWASAAGTSFAPNALPFGENNNVLYYKAEVKIGAK